MSTLKTINLKHPDGTANTIQMNSSSDLIINGAGSGNLLVVKSSQSDGATAGHEFLSDGRFYHTKSGDHVGRLNRLSTDGDILRFAKDGTTVGSIGYGGGGILFNAASNYGLKFYDAGGINVVHPATTSGADKDNSVDLGYSDSRFKDLYLSGGVYVGGTGSANLLDDYEEGTWTPSFNTSNSDMTITQQTQTGNYTKIGNVVTALCYIQCSTPSTAGTGNLQISGFPFSSSSEVCVANWTDAGPIKNVYDGTYTHLYGRMTGSRFEFRRVGSRLATNSVNPSDLIGGYFLMGITYTTTA